MTRYFLDVDPDSRYHLIPANKRAAWLRWVDKADDSYEWTLPTYAIPLPRPARDNGTCVTFTAPRDLKGRDLT